MWRGKNAVCLLQGICSKKVRKIFFMSLIERLFLMQLATFLSDIIIQLNSESITFTVWFSHLCMHKEPPQSLVCTQKKEGFFASDFPQRSRNQGKVGQKIEKWTLYSFIVVGIVATSIEISDLYLELRCEKHLMNLAQAQRKK